MIGVTLFAVSVATIVAGVSMATNKNDSAATAAAPAPRFDYCGGARQQDCVVDGDTFFLGAEKVRLAGVDAPAARGARCRREARLAIDATVRLRRLLNDGTVSLAGAASAADADGAVRRRVEVNGADVGRMMVGTGLASELAYGTRSWC